MRRVACHDESELVIDSLDGLYRLSKTFTIRTEALRMAPGVPSVRQPEGRQPGLSIHPVCR